MNFSEEDGTCRPDMRILIGIILINLFPGLNRLRNNPFKFFEENLLGQLEEQLFDDPFMPGLEENNAQTI
jgi:hypothetical protein